MAGWLTTTAGITIFSMTIILYLSAAVLRRRESNYEKQPAISIFLLGFLLYIGIALLTDNFTHPKTGDHIAFLCVIAFLYLLDAAQDAGAMSLRISLSRKPPKATTITPEAIQRYGRKMVPIPTLYPAYNREGHETQPLNAA